MKYKINDLFTSNWDNFLHNLVPEFEVLKVIDLKEENGKEFYTFQNLQTNEIFEIDLGNFWKKDLRLLNKKRKQKIQNHFERISKQKEVLDKKITYIQD